MTGTALEQLQTQLGALGAAWAGALPAFGVANGAADSARDAARARVDAELGDMSGPGLVRVLEATAALRRAVDSMLVRVGDEVAKRSAPEFGADGLAKQHGHASPARLLATATGAAPGEAARMLAVGEATRTRASFTGELLPAKCEHVRVGLDSAMLSVEAGAAIAGMLRRVEVRAEPALLAPYEKKLVEVASRSPMSLVARAVKLAEARLDTDGVAPTDDHLAHERSLTLREDANGMFHLRARLDPVTAAPLKAALDTLVCDALRRRAAGADRAPSGRAQPGAAAFAARSDATTGASRDTRGTWRDDSDRLAAGAAGAAGGPRAATPRAPSLLSGGRAADGSACAEPVIEDRRSIPQIQADALADLARHALGCAAAPAGLAKTTVVVRMDLDALIAGTGLAEIDGIDRPIAASTARRLAADAEYIPAVFGGPSLPLDLGRSARLFTRAQRLALAERDGGCASCGGNITYADAHHIDWWTRDTGPTDLSNGVMLCTACHHQVHDQGWSVRITDDTVWLIPPPHLDPTRAPRLGGKARYDPDPGTDRGTDPGSDLGTDPGCDRRSDRGADATPTAVPVRWAAAAPESDLKPGVPDVGALGSPSCT